MLSMVEYMYTAVLYSCSGQLYCATSSIDVWCHPTRHHRSGWTKLQEKDEEKGGRKTENGDFFCTMGVHVRDGMADLYRPLWGTSQTPQNVQFENPLTDVHVSHVCMMCVWYMYDIFREPSCLLSCSDDNMRNMMSEMCVVYIHVLHVRVVM